jgi:hypothetical protein
MNDFFKHGALAKPFRINTYTTATSVDSKSLTGTLNPLDATFTKKPGGSAVIVN